MIEIESQATNASTKCSFIWIGIHVEKCRSFCLLVTACRRAHTAHHSGLTTLQMWCGLCVHHSEKVTKAKIINWLLASFHYLYIAFNADLMLCPEQLHIKSLMLPMKINVRSRCAWDVLLVQCAMYNVSTNCANLCACKSYITWKLHACSKRRLFSCFFL